MSAYHRAVLHSITRGLFPLAGSWSGTPLRSYPLGRDARQNRARGDGGDDRIFTPLVTLATFLSQILSDNHSCRGGVARLNAWHHAQGLPASALGNRELDSVRSRGLPGGRLGMPVYLAAFSSGMVLRRTIRSIGTRIPPRKVTLGGHDIAVSLDTEQLSPRHGEYTTKRGRCYLVGCCHEEHLRIMPAILSLAVPLPRSHGTGIVTMLVTSLHGPKINLLRSRGFP